MHGRCAAAGQPNLRGPPCPFSFNLGGAWRVFHPQQRCEQSRYPPACPLLLQSTPFFSRRCRTYPRTHRTMDGQSFHQRTFKQRASIEGIGLHTGEPVRLTLAPAPADSGIVFVRTDLAPALEIPAQCACVVDTVLNTSLGREGVRIGTVEHLLAALAGCGIDAARIEVEGPEVPIADGSSAPFVQLIQRAGIHELRAPRRFLQVRKPVVVSEGDKVAKLLPARHFRMTYTIDFQHPLISDQTCAIELDGRSWGCR